MYAHKIKVMAEPSTDIVVRLPSDFPAGAAEVIVLSEVAHRTAVKPEAHERPGSGRSVLLQALAQRLPLDPALSSIVLNEGADEPLDEEDWLAELRP